MADIVIRIAGNIDDFDKALDGIREKTEGLEDKLETIAKTSAIAFAALTAEVGFSVKAYASQEEATNKLTQALGNQGIYSKALFDNYRSQADALQTLTGIDDDAIVKGQALLQGFIGQEKVSKDLTKAIVDLAAAQGMDLESAFSLVGKSIGSSTNALSRYGIEIDTNATKQEKMQAIIAAVNARFEGQAAAAAQGLGSLGLLKNTFGDLQEEIGKRFAPMVTLGIQKLTDFFGTLKQNEALVDLIVSLTTAGVVLSGLGVIVAGGGVAFLQLKAALAAAQIATSAMSIAVKGLGGATGIGLLVVVASEIYLNWSAIWPRMQAIFQSFVDNIATLGEGLDIILQGIFTLDTDLIKEGLNQAKSAFTQGYQEYKTLVAEQKQVAHEEEVAANEERQAQLNAQRGLAAQEELTQAQQVAEERKRLEDAAAKQRITDQAKAEMEYAKNKDKFGKEYAAIDKALKSDEVKGAKAMFGELAAAQNSGNATLRAAGKAAALANISIKTAEGAAAAFAGAVSLLGPIFGPPLGTSVAAGVIAFGAEQAGKIIGLADGGLVTGGIAGVDSVPIMGQAGELMAPRSNFEEVIGSVRAQREAEKLAERGLAPFGRGGEEGGGVAHVVLELKDDLVDFIEAKIIERQSLNLSLRGA